MQSWLNQDWSQADPDTFQLEQLEDRRQRQKLILIAALSLCPRPVRQALASSFANIDAEGFPPGRMGREEAQALLDFQRQLMLYRRYGDGRANRCTEYANVVEVLAQRRLARLLSSEHASWSERPVAAEDLQVNLQPLSGAVANTVVFDALLSPGDRVLSMALAQGGHLSHVSPIHRSGRAYQAHHYGVDLQTGRIDYDALEQQARAVRPRLIIAGASAYPWPIDWARLRRIADSLPEPAFLLADIAHTAGLVVAGLFPNPTPYADVTSLVTYKTLCGPRGAAIVTTDERLAARIDRALFPGMQSAPIMQNIAAVAVALKLALEPAFRELMGLVVRNAQALAEGLRRRGVALAYGGTATHLVVADLRALPTRTGAPLTGDVAARVLDLAGIVCNKNMVPGDTSGANAGGIRLGTTCVSQLGMQPAEMDTLAGLIHTALTAVEPFSYQGLRRGAALAAPEASSLPRGKLPFATLQAVSAGVDALLERLHGRPPAQEPPPAPAAPAAEPPELRGSAGAPQRALCLGLERPLGALLLSGERARAFLQLAGSADLFGAAPGQPVATALLEPDGRLLAPALALLAPPERPGHERLLLALPQERLPQAAAWLDALAHGYVLFGHPDLMGKIDGPLVIEDGRLLADPAHTRALLLSGPGLAALLERLAQSEPQLAWSTARLLPGSQTDLALLYLAPRDSARFAAALDRAAAAQGLALAAADLPRLAEHEGAELADLRKPFFVGRPALAEPPGAVPPPFATAPAHGPLRRTPLFDEHRRLGARTMPFAGWEMPLQYRGIPEEHRAVRQGAALFDLAHMGVLEVSGPEATWFLDGLTTNYVPRLRPGQGCYSFLLDASGAVLDDCYLYRLEPERYMLVVNAVNSAAVRAWLAAVARRETPIDADPQAALLPRALVRDLADPAAGPDQRVNIALQGPQAPDVLRRALLPHEPDRFARLRRNEILRQPLAGCDLLVARTGYTGEETGYELYVHPDQAAGLWRALLEAGALPAGLGARDLARIEAGLPLHGHELAGPQEISPIGAGYGAFVKFHKAFFVGRAALLQREAARTHTLVRFRVAGRGRRVVRAGQPVLDPDGRRVGVVTSAAVGPEGQVGLAYLLSASAAPGTPVQVLVLREHESAASPAAAVPAEIIPRYR